MANTLPKADARIFSIRRSEDCLGGSRIVAIEHSICQPIAQLCLGAMPLAFHVTADMDQDSAAPRSRLTDR
jgi:hypothetical protein